GWRASWRACPAGRRCGAAGAGVWWAGVAGVGAASSLPAMLSSYFGLAPTPSWLAAGAIVGGLHGAYIGLYAAWVAWLARRRAANPLLLAGGAVAREVARAHAGLGAPRALAAYSQQRAPWLLQLAGLRAPYGIGMLVASVNACAAAWWVPALRGRRPGLAAAAIAGVLVCVYLYGQWRLGQTFADGAAVRVAVVQGGAPPVDPGQRAARLTRYAALTRDGAAPNTDLIVWPESATEAYLDEASSTRDTVLRLSDDTRADLILGGPHYTPSSSGTRYHNSAYLVRNGQVAARYDKHRLVPFAED